MTREVLKCLLLLYESKEWPKKGTRRPTKTAKNTKIVIFGQKKSACGKPPAEENGPFPRETLFGPKKKRLRQAASQNSHFFCRKNGKKHQNRHEMVIHGSKWDVDHTKMIRKTRSTKPRSSYCAKTIKMKV